jgi:C4-dicarboxylate-specific signal transduction histidine kinase
MAFPIRVHREEGGDTVVRGFPNELGQVLINVLSNARDALAERKVAEGEVVIGFGGDEASAWINVRDNAGGIPEAALDKIFVPYFTTKEKGTGIGLYMSSIIMKNMGGSIEARNLEGGAEFRMILPRSALL